MKIYHYEVPADRQWHDLSLTGGVLHVDIKGDLGTVDIWALHTDAPPAPRTFAVYGTGEQLPDDAIHVASALSPPNMFMPAGALVLHLVEKNPHMTHHMQTPE